ncbi:sterol desaturase family protein [Hasllibacter sp. MH4015]|uniref:sterol desaturase family protein n=1 Tax=Hasllibacter sp. MH4015 TaxID=2854029 RepID=UPI001CD38351|nr:sterol desaturase family protein [Hasllibacter sp. MH4015]
MDQIFTGVGAVLDRIIEVFLFPTDPRNRIFWLYLITSVVAAYFVYLAIRRKGDHATEKDAEAAKGSFLRFLFPKSVWSHPSAWLDLRYALFHKVVSNAAVVALGAFALTFSFRLASDGLSITDVAGQETIWTYGDFAIAFGFMMLLMLVGDFIAWGLHYLQHKVPLLWQFHKVHHSAEVMHPISNFREHPVDNLVYAFFISLGFGATYGLAVQFFGFTPSMPTLFGVPLAMFVFNIVGYNLRHSHVWLRWPGIWSAIFPSPAHHHVHHSCHPDHIDKNFAFMFPVWDVIFGTYTMPDDNRDVKFGVPEEEGRNLDSVLNLYLIPFRDAFRLFVPKKDNADAQPVPEDRGEEVAQIPAE